MNNPSRENLAQWLRDAALIVATGVLVGVAVNGRLLWHVWFGQPPVAASARSLPDQELLPMPIALGELRELDVDTVLLIDARNVDLYLQGRLPGARSLPWGEINARLEAFLGEQPFDRPLVAYCSGYSCEDSFLLAQRLMAAGYRDVRVYEGGLPEWQDAGLPVEKGQP